MNADTLLYWLTDRAEGSWQQFETAVQNLGGEEARTAWYELATHGFIELSYGAGRRWIIREPVAFIVVGDDGSHNAIITGARTPELIRTIRTGAAANGCAISIVSEVGMPSRIRISGQMEDIGRLAAAIPLRIVVDIGDYFCGTVDPLLSANKADRAVRTPPINWAVRSFEFSTMSWVDGIGERTACEFTSKFGAKQSYLHARRGKYVPMARSEAVYSAAAIRGVDLASYDESLGALRIPGRAPLPVPYALWATIAAGSEVTFAGGARFYKMTRDAALPILVYLGRRCPEVWYPG